MRLSAKQVAFIEYCPNIPFLLSKYKVKETEAMRTGEKIHKKLNYNNQIKYEAEFPEEEVVLVGKPDRIGENYILELKITEDPKHLHKVYTAQLEIYLYLTGKPKGLLLFYSGKENRFYSKTLVINRGKHTEEYIKRLIEKAKEIIKKGKIDRRYRGRKCSKCYFKQLCYLSESKTLSKFL